MSVFNTLVVEFDVVIVVAIVVVNLVFETDTLHFDVVLFVFMLEISDAFFVFSNGFLEDCNTLLVVGDAREREFLEDGEVLGGVEDEGKIVGDVAVIRFLIGIETVDNTGKSGTDGFHI